MNPTLSTLPQTISSEMPLNVISQEEIAELVGAIPEDGLTEDQENNAKDIY